MLDLARQHGAVPVNDIHCYVNALEEWLIRALARFNVKGERRNGRVGIWIASGKTEAPTEAKIGAIGVRVSRWVSWHGVSLNVDPDLSHFSGIVPCGVREHGVTSLAALGIPATMHDADVALRAAWEEVFGATAGAVCLRPGIVPDPRTRHPAHQASGARTVPHRSTRPKPAGWLSFHKAI